MTPQPPDNVTATIINNVDTSCKQKIRPQFKCKKAKIIHIKGKDIRTEEQTNINLCGFILEKVSQFNICNLFDAENGSSLQDIRAKISMAKQEMTQLNNICKDKGIPNLRYLCHANRNTKTNLTTTVVLHEKVETEGNRG